MAARRGLQACIAAVGTAGASGASGACVRRLQWLATGCRLVSAVQLQQLQPRSFSSSTVSRRADERSHPTEPKLSDAFRSATEYTEVVDRVLEDLCEHLDVVCEDHPDGGDFDVRLGDGVLTVSLGGAGTYVINKQTPNRQIWLASPLSGPRRYDYQPDTNNWVYSHDSVSLHRRLSDELSSILKQTVTLSPPPRRS